MDLAHRPGRSQGGFSLVELLVVIVILSILAAIAVPSFLGRTEKANDTQAEQNLRLAYQAARFRYIDNHGQWISAEFPLFCPDANPCLSLIEKINRSEPTLSASASADSYPASVRTAGRFNVHVWISPATPNLLELKVLSESGNRCDGSADGEADLVVSCHP